MKPNVILFFADTLSKEDLSCYEGRIPTPNIDRIAKNGLQFDRTQPNSPVCSPARYNLLTGRYASRAQGYQSPYTENDPVFIRWNVYLDNNEKTLAHLFHDSGYRTGLCGKWHLGEPALEEFSAEDSKDNVGSIDKVARNYARCQELVRSKGGFGYVDALFTNNELAIPMPADMTCQHNQHWITQKAIEFMEQDDEKPFFLFCAPNLPHAPHVLDTLESGTSLTPGGFLDAVPDVQPSYESILDRLDALGYAKNPERNGAEWIEKDHAAAVMWLDDGVGAVLDSLKSTGRLEHTILAFTSDHLKRGKMTCHRQYVPFLLQWPEAIKGGSRRNTFASHVDIVRTLVELAGLTEKADEMEIGCDGVSFVSELKQESSDCKNVVYTEVCYARGIITPEYNYIATRLPDNVGSDGVERGMLSQEGLPEATIRFNAVTDFPGYFDRDQLYESATDNLEQKNLAQTDAYVAQVDEMKAHLWRRLNTFHYAFGEFTKANRRADDTDDECNLRERRGEENPIFVCESCAHIQFAHANDKCPVCGSISTVQRDDAIFYKSEEKCSEGVEYQIPAIRCASTRSGLPEIQVSRVMPDEENANYGTIRFFDVYTDGSFFKRMAFEDKNTVQATLSIPAETSRFKVIAFNSYYGYFQREVLLR